MANYSYHKSLREKSVNKVTRSLLKFHLTHQNVVLSVLGFIFTYLLVKDGILENLVHDMSQFGYISAFILGFMFSYGSLTIPASAAVFFLAKTSNPFGLAFVGAIGAMTSNFLIFRFVKHDFFHELRYVLANDMKIDVVKFEHKIHVSMFKSKFLQNFIAAVTGILISLPLPTRILASLLWTTTKFDDKTFLFYSFIFSFIGLMTLALFGHFSS